MRIVDDDGVEVPRGEPGEIVCRGFNVMLGYFEDEAATREAIDADGWLHTGDVGVMDDRGYLQITDRKKDMFIVGGFNVYPAEVENAILEHPDVAQVAVVSAPDARMGEVGVAFVVARVGCDRSIPTSCCAWCAPRMANYKVPRRAVVVDALPGQRERQGAEVRAEGTDLTWNNGTTTRAPSSPGPDPGSDGRPRGGSRPKELPSRAST